MKKMLLLVLAAISVLTTHGCSRQGHDLAQLSRTDFDEFLLGIAPGGFFVVSSPEGNGPAALPSGGTAFFTSREMADAFARSVAKNATNKPEVMIVPLDTLTFPPGWDGQLVLNPGTRHEKVLTRDEILKLATAAGKQKEANTASHGTALPRRP
jgi:hypothetical protein